jgi:hypothetical protein
MAQKIGNKFFNTTGMEESKKILQALAMMSATEAGADWVGGTRSDDRASRQVSNAEIIDFLAEGNTRDKRGPQKRDIRPNEAEGQKAVEIYADELVTQLNRVGMVARGSVKTVEQQARAGIVGGLRKAIKFIVKLMAKRVETGTTNTGARAKEVTGSLDEDIAFSGSGGGYAGWRYRKFGISESVVFIASGQLLHALEKGKIKIRFNSAGLGKVARIFKNG